MLTQSKSAGVLLAPIVMAVLLSAASTTYGAPGDLVGSVYFSVDCDGPADGLGTGITFDGTHLWYSCYGPVGTFDLYQADPTTGIVTNSYNIAGGLGTIAYDASRNVIWAGEGGGAFAGSVIKIPLDVSKNVSGPYVVAFGVPEANNGYGIDDGLAIDGATDTLYVSYDVSTTIHSYNATTGLYIAGVPWTGAGCYNSGLAIGGSLLFQGSDGCSHVWVVDKTTFAPAFNFTTLVAGDPSFRDEGLSCDDKTFASMGKHVMWSKEAYVPSRAHAFEVPTGTCGTGGQPSDCGCMDIAFVIDDTGSMSGAIANLQAAFSSIITDAVTASGGDLRMSVVSFSDSVGVDQGMTTVIANVQATIAALSAGGGLGEAEASDQGLRLAVTDTSPCGPTGAHGAFRPGCVNIAIMATDAPPGGCDDTYSPGVDDVEANAVANLALASGIKISAIHVLDGFSDAIEAPIMMNYATVTGGSYLTTPADGSGAGSAISAIIAECGGVVTPVCGDNSVNQPGEECDGTDDAACPGLCLPPGDPNECTCVVGCGNGVVEPPDETCDPPGAPAGANGNICRSDCTVCGDGVVQPGAVPDSETCDDGNNLECSPTQPQKPLDDCNNMCGGLFCKDPSRITDRGGLAAFKTHGRMVPIGGEAIDFASNDVSIGLTTFQGRVFGTSLPAGVIEARTSSTFKYKNKAAKYDGGVYRLSAKLTKDGTYNLTVLVYGIPGDDPMADMVTHVTVGDREWTVRGLWRQTGSGWVFDGRTRP